MAHGIGCGHEIMTIFARATKSQAKVIISLFVLY